MDTAAIRVAQKEDDKQGVDQQDIFDRMVLFLAAITVRLCSRVLGTDDTPFRPVRGKRGRPVRRLERGPRGLPWTHAVTLPHEATG